MSVPLVVKGFDVEATVERMLGRKDLWWDALGLFLQHFAAWGNEWQAVQGDDAKEQRLVHALRSGASNVGANTLACAAAVLEELLTLRLNGKPVTIPPSVRWYVHETWREACVAAGDARWRYMLSQRLVEPS